MIIPTMPSSCLEWNQGDGSTADRAVQICRKNLRRERAGRIRKVLGNSTTEETMEERIHYAKVAPGAYHAMLGLEHYLHDCGLEEPLLHLIKLRASQINGCAYCLDMHWKDLKAIGEQDQRLYELDAWEDSPVYSERERSAPA